MIQAASSARPRWGLLLAQGVILMILGAIALWLPFAATIAVDLWVGALFLAGGLFGLFAVIKSRPASGSAWTLVTAALAVFMGILLLWRPIEGAASLTVIMTAFFVVEGAFQIAASISGRRAIGPSWGWMLASGIADLLLAVVLLLAWPVSATWALGLLLAVNLITSGWAIAMIAIVARQTEADRPAAFTNP